MRSELWKFLQEKPEIAYNEQNKNRFKKLGKKFLKDVSNILKVEAEDIRTSYNPGGIAVSGDHSLYVMFKNGNGACVFFNVDGVCDFVTLRTIKALDDYTGGPNHNVSMAVLGNPSIVATELKRLAGVEHELEVR